MKRVAIITLALISSSLGHYHMELPAPLQFKGNQYSTNIDYNYDTPLLADGSDFPCKGHLKDLNTPAATPVATWTAGSDYNFRTAGSDGLGGGSCQASLSYDGGKTFRVLTSYVGNCPTAGIFGFQLPWESPASDNAIFAWTWFNRHGPRQMYMNCAVVKVVAGQYVDEAKWNGRPKMFIANIKPANGTATVEDKDVVFPQVFLASSGWSAQDNPQWKDNNNVADPTINPISESTPVPVVTPDSPATPVPQPTNTIPDSTPVPVVTPGNPATPAPQPTNPTPGSTPVPVVTPGNPATPAPQPSSDANKPSTGANNKPSNGGNANKPSNGGNANKPSNGGNANKPSNGGNTNKPNNGGNNQPSNGGNNQPSNGGNNKPSNGGNVNKPSNVGNTNKSSNGGNNKPSNGDNNKPSNGGNKSNNGSHQSSDVPQGDCKQNYVMHPGETCEFTAGLLGWSLEHFKALNPTIKCEGIKYGTIVCLSR